MIKKFAAVGVMVLSLTTCSTSVSAVELKPIDSNVIQTNNFAIETALSFQEQMVIDRNTQIVKNAIAKLKQYVGKTWYVFSGSTPSGWDCSGLTMWTYQQVGIELRHSASIQKNAGKKYKTPKIGDVVAFGWKNYSGAQHVGIYIGNGKMIHAPAPGQRTAVISVKKWAKMNWNTKVTYTRFIETN
jgi:cell wall-associated NlpC family hydrolase